MLHFLNDQKSCERRPVRTCECLFCCARNKRQRMHLHMGFMSRHIYCHPSFADCEHYYSKHPRTKNTRTLRTATGFYVSRHSARRDRDKTDALHERVFCVLFPRPMHAANCRNVLGSRGSEAKRTARRRCDCVTRVGLFGLWWCGLNAWCGASGCFVGGVVWTFSMAPSR